MLLSLSNRARDYAWGSTTLLAGLEGREPSSVPEAEVWFGDHPGDPADLADGRTLDEVTGGSLPYLLKLLAAADPLSIQVHPTREQAREGFARERGLAASDPSRNYRDDNHKPELIVPLSERFEALGGLRPLADTLRLLESFPESAGVNALRSRLQAGEPADALRETIGWLLSGEAQTEVDQIIAGLRVAESEEFAETLRGVRAIAERNPGDPGVVVALLMNFLVLRRGEAIFLRAGLLHAYVSGLGVEIMAASDNVLRGGLTPKHIDVDELLAVVDPSPGDVPVQRPSDDAEVVQYDVPVPDFALQRVRVDGERRIEVTGPTIALVTAGTVTVASDSGDALDVPVGGAAFASPDEGAIMLRGQGEVFVAEPGRN
ncbi:mannose-6-phosphate isomerase, class I [Microbacterium sp. NPDC058345]|uniref:mannose-6-phosphate isomerase, class I n=1 Tax=Microbacterium sp. NPDC058345 TaxID=3346455 RepID=UPI0036548BDE